MSRIRILDESTVNKIAAGEVIERPASVVKELVENSLDAGATDIRVRVSEAGKELIEVLDDGCGIPGDELKLAFVQHATSKINTIRDLESLGTLGFRGEALSSIAAVADIFISSRTAGSANGWSLTFKKGKPGEVKQVGKPVGTSIAVKNLFGGHPARLKYLKSDRVEVSHIIEIVTERALANAGISFRLHNGDIEVLNLPRAASLVDRISDVMGRRVAKEIVTFEASSGGIRTMGFLAKPAVTRSTRDGLYIFVNSRPVASSFVSEAVEDGYAGLLMRNRHPVGVLFLDIDPAKLDVNVHPTKRTVKFSEEKAVACLVSKSVADALGNTRHIPEPAPTLRELFPVTEAEKREAKSPKASPAKAQEQRELFQAAEEQKEVAGSRMLPRMKVIGQILDTYILAQSGTDLMIIDQHAAHERVMLDRLKNRPEKKGAQNLIAPILLSLGKKEAQLVEHFRPVIEGLGFKIEPFGKDTYLVRAVPAIGGHIETEQGLRDLVGELVEMGKAKSIGEKLEEIMHLVACHSAIKAGEKLSHERMALLIEEMHGLENPYTCAHGRPTIIRITNAELERMFKRVL